MLHVWWLKDVTCYYAVSAIVFFFFRLVFGQLFFGHAEQFSVVIDSLTIAVQSFPTCKVNQPRSTCGVPELGWPSLSLLRFPEACKSSSMLHCAAEAQDALYVAALPRLCHPSHWTLLAAAWTLPSTPPCISFASVWITVCTPCYLSTAHGTLLASPVAGPVACGVPCALLLGTAT